MILKRAYEVEKESIKVAMQTIVKEGIIGHSSCCDNHVTWSTELKVNQPIYG